MEKEIEIKATDVAIRQQGPDIIVGVKTKLGLNEAAIFGTYSAIVLNNISTESHTKQDGDTVYLMMHYRDPEPTLDSIINYSNLTVAVLSMCLNVADMQVAIRNLNDDIKGSQKPIRRFRAKRDASIEN